MSRKPSLILLLAVAALFATSDIARSIFDDGEQLPDDSGGPVRMRLFASPAGTRRPFAVTVVMRGCPAGAPLTLELLALLSLAEGEPVPVTVPPPEDGKDYSLVTWRIRARDPGWYPVTIRVAGTSWHTSWVQVHGIICILD
jgi:hypothetical protein